MHVASSSSIVEPLDASARHMRVRCRTGDEAAVMLPSDCRPRAPGREPNRAGDDLGHPRCVIDFGRRRARLTLALEERNPVAQI